MKASASDKDDSKNWKFVASQGDIPAFYVYGKPIEQSPMDDREYRVIRLENGHEAVLVHDAQVDKAATCLNVAVGYYNDPDDLPGLAHFCEHLLFMGSEDFPSENEYDEYLGRNDGNSNAITDRSDTTYFFSVASSNLTGALMRFSAFFRSPLFSESATMREINAIESEFSGTIQNDAFRIELVMHQLARAGHPYKKFGTGNKSTLSQTKTKNRSTAGSLSSKDGPIRKRAHIHASSIGTDRKKDGEAVDRSGIYESRRRLIEWWNKEYCAGRMNLAVIGRESLDELSELIATLFSPVKNRGQDPAPTISEQPFGDKELGQIVHIVTVDDTYMVTITFPIPYQDPLWRVKPADFLAHLLTDAGPGSLHTYLKHKGWAYTVDADTDEIGRGLSTLEITVDLTYDGFKNYREVIQICFKYLSLLHASELPEWVQDEIRKLAELDFRFTEKTSASAAVAMDITSSMKLPIPRALLLSAPQVSYDWDSALIHDTLSRLHIENSLICVLSQDHTDIGKTGPWLTEPWHGARYLAEKVDDDLISSAKRPNDIPELSLPKPNEFIPTNTHVEKLSIEQPKNRPALTKRTALSEVWYKKDDQFWTPRAQVVILMRVLPFACSSVRAAVLTRVFEHVVNDCLTEYAYEADVAGLSFDFTATMRALVFQIGGYNDKLHMLSQHVLSTLKNIEIKQDRLAVAQEAMKQSLMNALLSDPVELADFFLSYLLEDHGFTIEEQLEVITNEITVDELRDHAHKLLSYLKYTMLVDGNLTKDETLNVATMTEDIVCSLPLHEDEIMRSQSRLLPRPCNYVWEKRIPNPDEVNSGIAYYCHIGRSSNDRLRVTCALLNKIFKDPVFDILRSKEQLGYDVSSFSMEDTESIGWYVRIQSEKDPKYLENRINVFLIQMRGILEDMKESQIEDYKMALAHQWTKQVKNIFEESSRFWSHIRDGYYYFAQEEEDAELLMSVSKLEVLAMFKEFIDPASLKRSKLSIHMRPQSTPKPKLSAKAAAEFLAALHKARVPVDKEKFNAECGDEPDAAYVCAHWEDVLYDEVSSHKAKELLEEFDQLVKEYPTAGQGDIELESNAVFIEDGKTFRESLKLSGPARPVQEFEVE